MVGVRSQPTALASPYVAVQGGRLPAMPPSHDADLGSTSQPSLAVPAASPATYHGDAAAAVDGGFVMVVDDNNNGSNGDNDKFKLPVNRAGLHRSGWWRSVPQWSLYFLMPLASLQTCLALYHPNTMRRRPGIVFTEWWARATCRPWVMQASSKQVWGAV